MNKIDLSIIRPGVCLKLYSTLEKLPRYGVQIVFITYARVFHINKKTNNIKDYGQIFSGRMQDYKYKPSLFIHSGHRNNVRVPVEQVAYWGYLSFD